MSVCILKKDAPLARCARAAALRRLARFGFAGGGCAPAPGCVFAGARIIYALITVINNSGVENRVGAGAKPPTGAARRSVAGGATPSATTGC